MDYKILETLIKFNPSGTIFNVLALVEISEKDIRVLEASQEIRGGYMSISNRSDHVLYDLLQEVAEYGMEITDKNQIPLDWVKKYFK